MALNRNNRQKARSAFFGNNSGLETSKYSSDELRVLLLLYTGHIVSANPIFESKSRKVVVPSSLLLSEHINELLCSMSDTAYVDTSKKMICILNKKQKECKEDLLEFLLALRKHLNEEYSR